MLRARRPCLAVAVRNLSRIFGKTGVVDVAEEVEFALRHNMPIVALESTIVTHGMPFPKNAECARGVEEVVRKQVKYLVRSGNGAVLSWQPCINIFGCLFFKNSTR